MPNTRSKQALVGRLEGPQDSGSQKVQHYLDTISYIIEIIRSSIEVKTENSTDLKRAAAACSKSVEFSVFTSRVDELLIGGVMVIFFGEISQNCIIHMEV